MELGKSVERALLSRELVALPPATSFPGAGVYALYYIGDFEPYRAIAPPACDAGDIPIYVGRASPPGGRSGAGGLRPSTTDPKLFNRLREHARSISQVDAFARRAGQPNIRLADFLCRFLVVDDIWVALGEAVLIGHYQPLWNGFVSGFGIHGPGGGRGEQARSRWDTLHPGRPFAATRPPGPRTAGEIAAEVQDRLSLVQAPDLAAPPDASVVEHLLFDDLGAEENTDETGP
ncbi:MAG TPA: Eco29kI family restriction endonuclease [Streptosporangiaceae bacterium]|nr:Eco29kI family restriction endonuclease [Streptosporangiaceae bacterium]